MHFCGRPLTYRNYKGHFLRMDGWQERVFGRSSQGFQEFPDIFGTWQRVRGKLWNPGAGGAPVWCVA